jgi:hypothetical protein
MFQHINYAKDIASQVLSLLDLFLTPVYLIIIYLIASAIQRRKEKQQSLYKYFTKGIMIKCIGAISVCLVYTLYYKGGDTINYFVSTTPVINMMSKNFYVFLDIMGGNITPENHSFFDNYTGYPEFWRDPKAMFVVRIIVPLCMLSFQSYLVTSLLLASLCYGGIWRLFLVFNREFPKLEKQFAIAILFIPSVVFWGSGLLKDTITLSAVGWYTYSFYYFVILKRYKISYAIFILVSSFLLLSIKPYILFAILPGSLVWWSNQRLADMKSKFLKLLFGPILLGIGIGGGVYALSKMNSLLGAYAIDKVLTKAVESNIDQKGAYYGGNSFDIGEINTDPMSMLSKAHLAIGATLFRPFLWDARNPVMFISALENTYILLLTIFLLIRLKIFGFFRLIKANPLLLFSILFSLFFAFSVGIATSNFGSLVRLKIPCIPFFVASLFILQHLYEEKTKKKLFKLKRG